MYVNIGKLVNTTIFLCIILCVEIFEANLLIYF